MEKLRFWFLAHLLLWLNTASQALQLSSSPLMVCPAGGYMRISAHRRASLLMASSVADTCRSQLGVEGRLGEVVRLGSGEPLVLLPGLAGSWRLVMPLARRLAQRFQVIIPSLRGDANPLANRRPQEVADLAEDLGLTLEALGLERPMVLGVSFGAAVALEFAVENPGRLNGLALFGGVSRFEASLGSTIARRVLERFPLPNNNQFVNQFFNLLHGGKPEPGPLVDFIIDRCWETDQSVIAHRLGMLERFDVSDRLWRVDTPTIVIAGSRDVVSTPADQRGLARGIPGAQYLAIENAGHIGFLTHRAEVTTHLARFARHVKRSVC